MYLKCYLSIPNNNEMSRSNQIKVYKILLKEFKKVFMTFIIQVNDIIITSSY